MASYESLKKRLRPWDLQETMLFRDRKMEQLLELVHTIADTQATVLITGESGTGKSLLANYIHKTSSRQQKPFIKISCGSLSETLLESELFGHVRGAFTGAIRDKKGKFEEAHGGTVFLDDVNSASLNLQVKLLRVLQEKVIERVGGNIPIRTDVRIITATNTPLKEEVAKNQFREDLYYRINVVALNIPPLRERLGDIAPLAEHFISAIQPDTPKKNQRDFQERAADLPQARLARQRPGARKCHRAGRNPFAGGLYRARVTAVLPPARPDCPSCAAAKDLTLDEALAHAEKHILLETLERLKWNRKMCAQALGISRTTLFNKMRRFDLFESRRQTLSRRGAAKPSSSTLAV